MATVLGLDSAAPKATDPRDLLLRGIKALGGAFNLSQVDTVSYIGGPIYRTKGVMESYALGQDVAVASKGQQNLTFRYNDKSFRYRVDMHHELGDKCWVITLEQLENNYLPL